MVPALGELGGADTGCGAARIWGALEERGPRICESGGLWWGRSHNSMCWSLGAWGQWSPRGTERSGPESQGSSVAVGGPGGLWWGRDPGPAVLVGLTAGLGSTCGMEGGTGDTADPMRGWRG